MDKNLENSSKVNEDIQLNKSDIDEIEKEIDELEKENILSSSNECLSCVDQFFKDIQDIPLLSSKEEYEVACKAYMGDKEAKNKLIESNYRFVIWISKKVYLYSKALPLEDLVQEGMIGLMRAADLYNPEKGYKFSTYAYWWVKQHINRAIDNSGIIRIPVHTTEKLKKVNRAIMEFTIKEGRTPDIKDINKIYDDLCVSIDNYSIYSQINNVGSINSKVSQKDGGDEETELGDFIKSDVNLEDDILNSELRFSLQQAMNIILTEKEQKVITMRYFKSMTLEEVGIILGVTRERVRQIESKALRKLKYSYKSSRLLRDFTEI